MSQLSALYIVLYFVNLLSICALLQFSTWKVEEQALDLAVAGCNAYASASCVFFCTIPCYIRLISNMASYASVLVTKLFYEILRLSLCIPCVTLAMRFMPVCCVCMIISKPYVYKEHRVSQELTLLKCQITHLICGMWLDISNKSIFETP